MKNKKVIIIGAGPAGLTAAYELLKHTDLKPVVFEMDDYVGGIARTVRYKGNRIDIGGHRFFSKSDRVMNWWQEILPLSEGGDINLSYQNKEYNLEIEDGVRPDPEKTDKVMLLRGRLSRIMFLRKFFEYPLSLSFTTLRQLGFFRTTKIGFSYIKARVFPRKPEKTLEDYIINRFGKELYSIFFKDYTEKVWGVPCSEITAEWGAQRIKGLSIKKAIYHAARSLVKKDNTVEQKNTETSLINQFLYPKHGPGQLWEEVADIVKSKGGEIFMNHVVVGINKDGDRIVSVDVKDINENKIKTIEADYVISTMAVKHLIRAIGNDVPSEVKEVSEGLIYRDFMTVGLLLDKLAIKSNEGRPEVKDDLIPDNWIYIQEPDVQVGRLQIFNNWSPYMVKDKETVWLGLEYFCNKEDDIWKMSDEEMSLFAIEELESIGLINKKDLRDSVVIRMEKTYPAYFGSYSRFGVIRKYTDNISNLFLIGRNGMHRYNNQDHSMLTAMTAVEHIVNGITDKSEIWEINTEGEYHEEK